MSPFSLQPATALTLNASVTQPRIHTHDIRTHPEPSKKTQEEGEEKRVLLYAPRAATAASASASASAAPAPAAARRRLWRCDCREDDSRLLLLGPTPHNLPPVLPIDHGSSHHHHDGDG